MDIHGLSYKRYEFPALVHPVLTEPRGAPAGDRGRRRAGRDGGADRRHDAALDGGRVQVARARGDGESVSAKQGASGLYGRDHGPGA